MPLKGSPASTSAAAARRTMFSRLTFLSPRSTELK